MREPRPTEPQIWGRSSYKLLNLQPLIVDRWRGHFREAKLELNTDLSSVPDFHLKFLGFFGFGRASERIVE